MRNFDIRQYALEKRVDLWQVSEKLGYSHESSFSRILRHELPKEKKKEVFNIIDELSNVDFGELSPETATIRYMSMMNDIQKQAVCACASQILLQGEKECEQ